MRLNGRKSLNFGAVARSLLEFVDPKANLDVDSTADDLAVDEAVQRFASAVQVRRKQIERKFDVFLCHNSTDKDNVRALGRRLKEKGYLPWLDEWNLRPGMSWLTAIQSEIEKIHSAAVIVGESGIGPWQDMEIQALLQQFVKRHCPVIPVILPNCSNVPELPIFLSSLTWVDFRKLDPDPLRNLIWGLTGA